MNTFSYLIFPRVQGIEYEENGLCARLSCGDDPAEGELFRWSESEAGAHRPTVPLPLATILQTTISWLLSFSVLDFLVLKILEI